MTEKISIILPARNESESLKKILPKLKQLYSESEIIVVDDASTDDTGQICLEHGVKVIRHPYNMGNGAAIKTGARNGTGDIFVFMDADGQHTPEDIPLLLEKFRDGYKMVVGARTYKEHASALRLIGNTIYNKLASCMTGFNILDLTSGFRAVNAGDFKKFIYLLPNGFSYPTTITMAFFRSSLPVCYVPIKAHARKGNSHLNIYKEGIRFFIIILKVGALFSPMRLFLPVSIAVFATGISYYLYTFLTSGRFTNMGALLLLASLVIFLMGILSELVSSLHYRSHE